MHSEGNRGLVADIGAAKGLPLDLIKQFEITQIGTINEEMINRPGVAGAVL